MKKVIQDVTMKEEMHYQTNSILDTASRTNSFNSEELNNRDREICLHQG